jgi:hypothetical protein
MPKVDGCYARLTLDGEGRIASVVSRSGESLREASDLIGILAGPPDSVLHGELEAHTEAGNRASSRGWRNVHLFDCTRLQSRDVSTESYSSRYGMLHAMQAAIECEGLTETFSVDESGNAHDKGTGRFVVPAPRNIRRLPIVQLARGAGAAESLWSSFVQSEGGEGLVAVRLDAPAGARGAKRKIKQTETLDCVVVSFDARAATLCHEGTFFVVAAANLQLVRGAVVEVACDGWYESGTAPRFPRIVRERTDLRSYRTN